MILFNLLPFRPGNHGLSVYTKRIIEGWEDNSLPSQLRFNNIGHVGIFRDKYLQTIRNKGLARLMQDNGMEQYLLSARLKSLAKEASIIYSPYNMYIWSFSKTPQVVTCHDLTPLHYPNSYKAYWLARHVQPRFLERAHKIIAISKYVADRLIESGHKASKISIVPNGVWSKTEDDIDECREMQFMVVSRHDRNKHIEGAIKGFKNFTRRNKDWRGKLIILGKNGRMTKSLKRLTEELGLHARVVWLEEVEEEVLKSMIMKSYALISPSLMEGFNYPVMEAQGLGLPTIVSDIPVHRELYEASALLFDPYDDGRSLGDKLSILVNERGLWLQLAYAGIQNARYYTVARQVGMISEVLL